MNNPMSCPHLNVIGSAFYEDFITFFLNLRDDRLVSDSSKIIMNGSSNLFPIFRFSIELI